MITILIVFLSVAIVLLGGELIKTKRGYNSLKEEVMDATEKIKLLEGKLKNEYSLVDDLLAERNEFKTIQAEHYDSPSDKTYKDEATKENAIKTKLALKIGNELVKAFGAPAKPDKGHYVYFFKVKRV